MEGDGAPTEPVFQEVLHTFSADAVNCTFHDVHDDTDGCLGASVLPLCCVDLQGAGPEFIGVPVPVFVAEGIRLRIATTEGVGPSDGVALCWHCE